MTTLNPWINFNGNAEEAFTFYKSVFGGEFTKIIRFKDIASTEFPIPEKEENKIMYIALPISEGNVRSATTTIHTSPEESEFRSDTTYVTTIILDKIS